MRVEAKGRATLQSFGVGVLIDVLELFVGIVRGYVRGFRNRRIHPLLRGRLDIHVLLRRDVLGRNKVIGEGVGIVTIGRRIGIHEFPVGEHLEGEHVDFFLGLLAFADDITRVLMGKKSKEKVDVVIDDLLVYLDCHGFCSLKICRNSLP